MKAAVFHRAHEPVPVEDVTVDKPRGREVLVRTVASGVCHSDLHLVDGTSVRPVPLVIGHEGAGIVEAVGEDVTSVKAGDHVVGCLSGFCGMCEQCLQGHPNMCANVGAITSRPAGMPPRLSQGSVEVGQFGGVGSYAEEMLMHENSLVKIDPEIPLDRAALVGCGVLTGVGAALRTARVEAGQTVAVFGCGGVGLSIVQGARIAGASRIIAVDVFDSKLEMAKGVGATDGVNASQGDPVQAIRDLTRGAGVDHAFEAVGSPALVRQAVESLAVRGTATVVGVLPVGASIEFPWLALRPECRLQTSRMGSNRFRIDIPAYLEFYRQGRLLLDEMISARAGLQDLNDAFRAMKAGEVARTVLMFE